MSQEIETTRNEERIAYFEEMSRLQYFALELISALGSVKQKDHRNATQRIKEASETLNKILPFSAHAFYLIDDMDSDFSLSYCCPESETSHIEQEVQRTIENNDFSWALNQNRMISSSYGASGEPLLLHALATGSRVQGMFVGILKNQNEPHLKEKYKLATLILQYLANSLESYSLFNELDKKNRNLEGLVAQRTSDLTLEKERAIKANQSKSLFLTQMSHELRTPMNSILGFAQLLQIKLANKLEPVDKDNISKIVTGGEHLLKLINEILDLARIESGKLDLKPEHFNIKKAIEEVCLFLQPLAKSNQVKIFQPDFQSGDIPIHADYLRFKQVLINLVSNAIKYNRPEGTVRLECEDRDDAIIIQVTDTGQGIPEDQCGAIFEPFVRLVDDPQKVEGTGIGLGFTRQLMQLMGGDISVESKLGSGSRFTVDFPKGRFDAADSATNTQVPEIPSPSAGNKKYKIVYIEDNLDNIELVRQILGSRKNCHLITATNAVNGIKIIEHFHPDLILMDLHLPGMSGWSAFQAIQAKPDIASTPIVALSANAMKEDIQKSLDMGFRDYFTKPLNIGHFIEVVERILSETNTPTPQHGA